jgi:hypothetical protein
MTEAFPWDTAPRYLLRDRDKSYGPAFRHRVRAMDISEVITAARSPWQNPYAERLIGSTRRECLDHVIILSERHLRRVLSSYFHYHHNARTHLSLDKDCPRPRAVQLPCTGNNIIAFPQVGGLHHRYERRAVEIGNRRALTLFLSKDRMRFADHQRSKDWTPQAGETVGVYLFYAARSEHTAANRERIAEALRREYDPPRGLV